MSHYFDESPASPSAPATVRVDVPGATFTLRTDRGVFSHGHLDRGTEVLLRTAPDPPATGDLLDLGCGAGAIALTMACRSPGATVWAVDVNARARALCAANARDNAIPNVHVVAPDDVTPDVRFAAIWSNPPIRIGKSALHDLLDAWLDRLTSGGSALLVVHKHLGSDSLQRWLIGRGWPTDRLSSTQGYRVLRVTSKDPLVGDGPALG
jgi:16S rRNA (guanine1207-N2)-methyltransferase